MNIIKQLEPQKKLIPLKDVPDFTVVRHEGRLYFHSTKEWLIFAMEPSPRGKDYLATEGDRPLVEIVDTELIVKS